MIKLNRETVAGQRRHRPPPTGGRFCDTAATACVQEAPRTPSSTKSAGKVHQQPSNELGGCLRRKFSPSTVPEPPLTDGRAKTTHNGRLN